jgi:DNA-binding transcriptional ArsR family regulator
MDIAEIGALVGDHARARMLGALMGGRALTATELAATADVSASTASAHLARLTSRRLLRRTAQGRHRYFALASPKVAAMLETLLVIAAQPEGTGRRQPRIDPQLREARTCYDHLAGRLGVELADALVARAAIRLEQDAGEITPAGAEFLVSVGVKLRHAAHSSRPLCRPCMDWTERRPHIAGALGAALLDRFIALGWLRRAAEGRAVIVTSAGQRGLAARLSLRTNPEVKP